MGEHHPAASPDEAQALAERVAAAMYERDRASQALGMHIVRVGAGHAELTMRVRADMLNGHLTCHGGFIFSLADSAFAFACNSHGVVTVAAGFEVDFLESARLGDELVATAVERALRGRSGLYDVTVRRTSDDTVIAEFRGRSRSTGDPIPG